MMIGGNIQSIIQVFEAIQNDIGEDVASWTDRIIVNGWLDFLSGESNSQSFNAKIQQSTHVFMCDWFDLDGITAENSRMMIDGKIYEITLIDDPMELHQHLEFYLKFLGGV